MSQGENVEQNILRFPTGLNIYYYSTYLHRLQVICVKVNYLTLHVISPRSCIRNHLDELVSSEQRKVGLVADRLLWQVVAVVEWTVTPPPIKPELGTPHFSGVYRDSWFPVQNIFCILMSTASRCPLET